MIKGIGIDIIELSRVQEIINRKPQFVQRILTEKEQTIYKSYQKTRQIEYLAGRFAAKEAFSKAMGTGIGKKLSFQDIEVDKDSLGKPFIAKPFQQGVHLSITHSKEYAFAQVIIEK
ncbi:holo-ACP synthase [Niallia sp. 01092]|uniref:holo-ACP synthase n=1 Tax=unclassified Niallia TaxID=2837522 RepID=UPI003FD45D8C